MEFDVNIIDVSLRTEVDFSRPLVKSEADPVELVCQLSKDIGQFLDAEDVFLDSADDLFDYSLTVPMFKGSGEFVLKSQSLTVAFKNGRDLQGLNLMKDATETLLGKMNGREISRQRVTFNCVANFLSESDSQTYLGQFENEEKGVTGGGFVIFASGGKVNGDIRLNIEKFLGTENAVFVSAIFTSQGAVPTDSWEALRERLVELTLTKGLRLTIK